jgi:hypothetical protein
MEAKKHAPSNALQNTKYGCFLFLFFPMLTSVHYMRRVYLFSQYLLNNDKRCQLFGNRVLKPPVIGELFYSLWNGRLCQLRMGPGAITKNASMRAHAIDRNMLGTCSSMMDGFFKLIQFACTSKLHTATASKQGCTWKILCIQCRRNKPRRS